MLGLAATSVSGALGGHLTYAQAAEVFRWQPLDDPAAPRNPA